MTAPAPAWAPRWLGRYERELEELKHAGIAFTVDAQQLAAGKLVINFTYEIAGSPRQFRANFPDEYPRFRPLVFLLGPPEERPARHCSPIDGNVCVLGRDTRQWPQDWTLARLIKEQLNNALTGSGEEDPQGEPAEFWWNSLAEPHNHILVGSELDLGSCTEGTLLIRYKGAVGSEGVTFRAAVVDVRAADGRSLGGGVAAVPSELTQTATLKWRRLEATLLPTVDQDNERAWPDQMFSLCGGHMFPNTSTVKLGLTKEVKLASLVYPMEVGPSESGLGWTFIVVWREGGGKMKLGTRVATRPIRVLRAGSSDLTSRSPGASVFVKKHVLIYGAGAIGSFLAIELARNGCAIVSLVDWDIVEPGNSVRWPLGVPAWGNTKVGALKEFIELHYPGTEVRITNRMVGDPIDEARRSARRTASEEVDLVIDATASYSVATWLFDECAAHGTPLISVFGSSNMASGLVGVFHPSNGCPRCLEIMWANGDAREPSGFAADEQLIQPVGCSERTFQGSSTDIQELALQAVRLTASVMAGKVRNSVIATVNFEATEAGFPLPVWSTQTVNVQEGCECSRFAA